jgi:hypothetical protein
MRMFIIEARKDKRTWISGILQDEDEAKEYFNLIPDNQRGYQSIVSVCLIEYPFYIVEETTTFTYLNLSDVVDLLNNISKMDDDDHVYFNLYFIIQDYRHSKPGVDYMGSLSHIHIDNQFLELYQQYGQNLLVRNGMA